MSSRKCPHCKTIEAGKTIIYLIQTQLNFMSNLLDPKELQRVIKWAIYMYKTLSGCLEELKNKGKVQLGNPKSGPGHL